MLYVTETCEETHDSLWTLKQVSEEGNMYVCMYMYLYKYAMSASFLLKYSLLGEGGTIFIRLGRPMEPTRLKKLRNLQDSGHPES